MANTPFTRKKKELHQQPIINIQPLGNDAFTIEVERKFDFLPGQIVAVDINPDSDEPRLYSIASGKDSSTLKILFDINPNGLLTPSLAKLKKGDNIFVSKPFGKFIGTDEPAWWIATGTGIAPFISMTESGMHTNKVLLHGSRTLDRFYFQDLFKLNLKDNYLRFCTKEKSPEVHEGRLTQYLIDQPNLPKAIKYYLCGSAEMIINVREILIEQKGIPFENIISEIYF